MNNTLNNIEIGESSLSLKTLASIVSFTGSSTDFILFGDNFQNSLLKILSRSSNKTVEFIYKLINEIYHYNKK